jgi:hypothetical protein
VVAITLKFEVRMEERDYLKKQIDQLGRVLGNILSDLMGLKNQGNISQGIEITNQAVKSELDFDLEALLDIPTDIFIETLTKHKNVSNENLEKLAEIFFLIADNTAVINKNIYEKCLVIFEYLEKAENVYSLDRQCKIERIKNEV